MGEDNGEANREANGEYPSGKPMGQIHGESQLRVSHWEKPIGNGGRQFT